MVFKERTAGVVGVFLLKGDFDVLPSQKIFTGWSGSWSSVNQSYTAGFSL